MLGQLGELLELPERKLERLADLTHRGAETIGRKDADEPCVLGAVLLVDAENELLADIPRKVEVDVGDAPERLVQEATQEEVVLHRVDVREADQIADDRRDRGAASPAGRQPR